ncbi:MAG TPA: DNA repair protein RecO, partial [Chitinophagaceae bacterium]|nr:DNA repair protein RecO [Chitinophagaceae bacterium]
MQIHSTKGIVIRAVKYGDTSIIATIYTQLFGLQSYIIKGVRGSSAKSTYKANCFQPAAILELEVYHHPQKQIQFIKNYSWSYVYKNIFSNVICNSVAIYIIELLQHSIKQPEPNTDLYNFIEETLIITDTETKDTISNLPIFFTLLLCNHLGFKINGCYLEITPVLDFQEGTFVAETPTHNYFAVEWEAETISW